MNKIREALEALLMKHNLKERVTRLTDGIMPTADWNLEQRLELVNKVRQWINQASIQGVESVTLEM